MFLEANNLYKENRMKSFITIAALLILVACGKGSSGPGVGGEDGLAGNKPVLLDENGVQITSVVFPQVLNPTYDSYMEVSLQIRNDGTHAGKTFVVTNGDPSIQVVGADAKCSMLEPLEVGETCNFKVRLTHIGGWTTDGVKTTNLELYNADGFDNRVSVEGEIQTL